MKISALFLVACVVVWQIEAKTLHDQLEKDTEQGMLMTDYASIYTCFCLNARFFMLVFFVIVQI